MKKQLSNAVAVALFLGLVFNSQAQSNQQEPVFGTVVVKKHTNDSTKKKSSFNLFRPAFFRLGIIGGGLISLNDNQLKDSNGGGLLGLRAEYGLSNRFSVVGQLQNNLRRVSAFPKGQASIGLNWMPFKSQRVQPFVGLAVGIGMNNLGFGRDGFGRERNRFQGGATPWGGHYPNPSMNNDSLSTFGKGGRDVQGFGLVRTGVNYVLARRIIGTLEGTYQLPFNNSSNTNGGFSLALGLSYQFGRIKK
jgi:hypothetical protein